MKPRRKKRRAHWAAYLWPGLAHLWVRGSWAGLALAIGFTCLLNVLVLSVLAWPEWLAPRVRLACGASAAVIWLWAVLETRGELRRLAAERQESPETEDQPTDSPVQRTDAPFRLAQRLYLRADWSQAERTLREVLREDKDDVEAHLLLAAVHRRADRPADATRRLKWLATRDAAAVWLPEIQRELLQTEHGSPSEGPQTDAA